MALQAIPQAQGHDLPKKPDYTKLFPFEKLKGKLNRPKDLLDKIGFIWKAYSQKAFDDQALGDYVWPRRYPNMTGNLPFINVAAALSDLNDGNFVRPSRLDRRPALRGENSLLMNSINWDVSPQEDSVAVWVTGSIATEYAGYHQWGSPPDSVQPVHSIAKTMLAAQMDAVGEDSTMGQALKRLGFLHNIDELSTQVSHRPFLGITNEFEEELREVIESHLEEENQVGT